jgi:rhodanese-related sulfurtransferase
MMPHVMGIMEAEIAGFIQEELVSYGVSLYTDKALAEIESKQVKLKDGTRVEADMVLMSIGVRPTLKLAQESGLELGNAGGLLVDETLKTSDESIYAAGDMIELEHRILGKKVRIPLAGPANRQGRIAAENALGKTHAYKGSIGTSIVRVFEAVAGTTGISLKAARAEGINADAIVVHKEHHTSYYPGAEMVSVMVVYDKDTGTILGGQTAGYEGADRRLDVLATAVASKLTVSDLSDIDFAYSPPLGNANDAINMAAYTAENRITGFSPALTASELDHYLVDKKPLWIDVRDVFSYERAHVEGAINIPLEILFTEMNQLPKDKLILVYDQTGKKGHQALRLLKGAGFDQVINVSGGFISLSNYVRAMTPKGFGLDLPAPEVKTLGQTETENSEPVVQEEVTPEPPAGPLVIDVRTGEEYAYGAVPDAINISLDALEYEIESLNDKDRKIILYCATGARSAYGVQLLQAYGFTNVENGGGLSRMMARVRSGKL